jgi:uncharacterized protein
MPTLSPFLIPIVLLVMSNVFMTFAWYDGPPALDRHRGQLVHRLRRVLPRRTRQPHGSYVYPPAQLKTMQEVITLVVFSVFSVIYLKASFTLNHLVGFMLIAAGAFFVFKGPL